MGLRKVVIVILMVSGSAWADTGDDFTNNLFSDLAPLLALFGEQFAKQFMSESMGWLDHVIFAMAPLGIITAIISAIRVGGPSWLRAVIGRARENRAASEVELMSSTSHEVCELWNGQAVVRMVGRPEVQQLVFLKYYQDQEELGLYTVTAAEKAGYLRSETCDDPLALHLQSIAATFKPVKEFRMSLPTWLRRKGFNHDEENPPQIPPPESALPSKTPIQPPESTSSSITPIQTTHTEKSIQSRDPAKDPSSKAAPNISLNLHGGSKLEDLYTIAACGIVLQLGVLIFSGLAVYYPGWSSKFQKNNRPIQSYAYPLMAAGTVVLVVGMIICSAVIEQSTTEEKWVVSDTPPPNRTTGQQSHQNRRPEIDNIAEIETASLTAQPPKAHLLWLQKSHTVSDQSFESFVIFARDTRDAILSSRRSQNDDLQVLTARSQDGDTHTLRAWFSRIASTSTEAFTCVGTLLSLAGFVAQFQGFRGLHWASSISQLVAVFAMTMFRAWVRRSLIARPRAEAVLDGCEMDWLSITIARDGDIEHYVKHEDKEVLSEIGQSYTWTIATGAENLALRGSWAWAISDGQNWRDDGDKPVRIRQRLGELTKWVGPASKPAISVASAIAIVMNTLVDNTEHTEFCWFLKVAVNGSDHEDNSASSKVDPRIEFKVKRPNAAKQGGWTADATEIEAALSLWIYHIRKRERDQSVRGEKDGDWLQEDVLLVRKSTRLLGKATPSLERDLKWWIGSVQKYDKTQESNDLRHLLIGFTGLKSEDKITDQSSILSVDSKTLSVDSEIPSVDSEIPSVDSEIPSVDSEILSVDSEIPLEILLGQHIFSAFMWAIAEYISEHLIRDGKTIVENRDPLGSDNALLSSKLENSILRQTAKALQSVELVRTTHEAYLCIIPALSNASKLPSDAIVDFVWQQTRDDELRGNWDRIAVIHNPLFDICMSFGAEHMASHRALSVLAVCYRSLSITLQERKDQQRECSALENLRDRLSKQLQRFDSDILVNLAELYQIQKRFDLSDLVPSSMHRPFNESTAVNVHRFFRHPLFARLKQKNIWSKGIGKSNYNIRDILGCTPLHYAAWLGEGENARQLLLEGAKPTSADLSEWTPLHYAAEKGAVAVVRALLEHGADVEMRGRDGMRPLHCAARFKSDNDDIKHVASVLLGAGANMDIQDNSQKSPLHLAAYYGNRRVVDLLLERGAYAGERDDYGRTALHLAAMSGDDETVQLLLDRDMSTTAIDRGGATSLYLAAQKKHGAVVRLLLERDFDKVAKENVEEPVHYWATWTNHEAVARLLLESDLNKVTKDEDGGPSLHWAARNGHETLVRLLLKRGVNKEATAYDGKTALLLAVEGGHEPIVRRLLQKAKVNLHANYRYGKTALHIAASNGNEAVICLLLEHGIDKKAVYGTGRTALHIAASNGYEEVVRLLLQSTTGAKAQDINMEAQDKDGWTPLHAAALDGYEGVAQLLLEHSIDKETRNMYGRTALHMAASNGHEAVVQLLLEWGANTTAQDIRERTALHMAAEDGRDAVVKLLLKYNVDKEIKDSNRRTAFHLGALNGHEAVVRVLLRSIANPVAKDAHGRTALHLAAYNVHEMVVRLLLKQVNKGLKDNEGKTALDLAMMNTRSNSRDAVIRMLEAGKTLPRPPPTS